MGSGDFGKPTIFMKRPAKVIHREIYFRKTICLASLPIIAFCLLAISLL